MTTTLAPRLTITEIVRVYEQAAAEIRGSFARLSATQQLLNDTFTMEHWSGIRIAESIDRTSYDDPERTLLRIRHEVWRSIIDRLEVRRMMSIERWKELERQLDRHELPEITHESVEQLLRGFQSSLPQMLAEAVEEVFAWLRPRRSAYKTNSELEVPERVVLTRMVERWDLFTTSWRVNYHVEPQLTALEQVFSALDGAGQITKAHYSAISNTIRAEGFDGSGETPYFRFRVFKNGNMHLQFVRLDLLARFNQIAGGRRLRPSAA